MLPSLVGGGAEQVTLQLIAGLDRRRFGPHLVLLDRNGPLQTALTADVTISDLGRPRLRSAIPALLATLRQLKPSAVYSTLGYVNLALAAMRGLYPGRLLLREANMPSTSLPQSPWPRLTAAGYRLLYPRADRIVATSQAMAGELAGFGIPVDRISILRNPVAVDRLRERAAAPRRAGGTGLRLVAAGRLVPQKGFDRLIPLLAGIPDMHLTILGNGPMRGELAALALRHGIALDLPGFTEDAAAFFAGADAVLVPSRWEGMPNVALEALACGTPVLATPEAGGIAELAAVAPAGAVTLAAAGPEFSAAVRRLPCRPPATIRPALLPAEFDAAAVGFRFAALLDSLTDDR